MMEFVTGFCYMVAFNRLDWTWFFFLRICVLDCYLSIVYRFLFVKRSIVRSSWSYQGEIGLCIIRGNNYLCSDFYSEWKSVFLKKLLELIMWKSLLLIAAKQTKKDFDFCFSLQISNQNHLFDIKLTRFLRLFSLRLRALWIP